jgi:1,3-beta-galactosyl-N-acetylhexosamine phosphorylase
MMDQNNSKAGRFTLPAQEGMDKEVLMLAKRWGVDILRDSDGTSLSPELTSMDFEIYSTLCLIRMDQEWAKKHPDHCQQKFLMSDRVVALGNQLEVEVMKGFNKEQFTPDTVHDIKKYWEVIDRTSGELVPTSNWDYDSSTGLVNIQGCIPYHVYTVNFLVYQIWETTSMYNYITNNWTGEHQMGLDPRQPATYVRMMEMLDQWLVDHPDTTWVRFTSMAYQFPIITNENRQTRFQDWCGYTDTVSALALDEFEKEHGYRLRAEDFVDKGYYNSTSNVPSRQYLDWIRFVNKFLIRFSADCVKKVHDAGKKAILFFCDHWIGTEPYWEEEFRKAGFDALVTPVINGRELRRVADVPGNYIKEARLYPYFFPVNLQGDPSFAEGGDPVKECRDYWMWIRRAMVRRCVDRIGFGGYLDLAMKYPEFIDYVESLSNEFRSIVDNSGLTRPYAACKVAVINAWGKTRSWLYDFSWPLGNVIETLSGLPVEVEFLSLDDIKSKGVPTDVHVLINAGKSRTAWSGDYLWSDPIIQAKIREHVAKGGGFIGIQEPTAHENQGVYFQLPDVLGVQREVGLTLNNRAKLKLETAKGHFILDDSPEGFSPSTFIEDVYPVNPGLTVLAQKGKHLLASANEYIEGRAVYLAGFEFSQANNRLLERAIYWAAGIENTVKENFTTHPGTELAIYSETGMYFVFNNLDVPVRTSVFVNGKQLNPNLDLDAHEGKWFNIN